MKLSENEKKRLQQQYGPWAVVTGASSGIGLAIAERLAEAGLNLIINARNEANLTETAEKLKSVYKIEVTTVAADLSQPAEIEKLVAASKTVQVGLLVASAGFGTSGSLTESSVENELNLLKVNCEAVLALTHYFAGYFVSRQKGGIILLSSITAFQGVPYSANYAASKAYIQSLAEGLYHELKPLGVDVLAAAPGPVASGFGERANMKMDMTLKPDDLSIPVLKALGRKSTVLPGFLSKFLTYSLQTLPRWGKVLAMKKVMEGMTKHQRV